MADLIQYSNGVPAIRFKLDKPVTYIGRNAELNDICILDSFMSKQHALIERRDGDEPGAPPVYVLRDLGSTNRTYVNREAITVHALNHKDLIRFGEQEFRFLNEPLNMPLPVEGSEEMARRNAESADRETHPGINTSVNTSVNIGAEEDTRELPGPPGQREVDPDTSSASGRFSRRLNILT